MSNYGFTGDYAEDCKEHQVLNGRLVYLQTMESGFKNVENGFKNPETQVKDVQTGVARIDRWILLLVGAVSGHIVCMEVCAALPVGRYVGI